MASEVKRWTINSASSIRDDVEVVLAHDHDAALAEARKELAIARAVIEKLKEQRDFYRKDARDEHDAKLAAKTDDAEIAALESKP